MITLEAQRLCHQIRARNTGSYYRELVNTIGVSVFFATRKEYIGLGCNVIASIKLIIAKAVVPAPASNRVPIAYVA